MPANLRRRVPASWLELNVLTLELVLGVALLFGMVSSVAMATGDPETMALVALAGAVVVLLGLATVRLFEGLGDTGTPLVE